MIAGGGSFRFGAIVGGVVATALLMVGVTACGGGSDDGGAKATTSAGGSQPDGSSTTDAEPGTTDGSSTTGGGATTTTAAGGLPGASEGQHTAPGDGTGTALLKSVRVGSHEGFERIVFEFAGTSVPGYRVQWVDGPITADGSGDEVEVAGEAFLEIVMQPASGVDLSAPQLTIVYQGPDRVPVAGQTTLITDLVRTGDFEAVLSWAAGTTERVPFRVQTFTSPVRVVIDLADA